jgi:hypothetical protein
MKRTITVLQDDIDKGLRNRATQCAIARAAKRDLADLLTGDYTGLAASPGCLTYYGGSYEKPVHGQAKMPVEASAFIHKFDTGDRVEPFKFEIEITEGVYL